MVTNSKLSPGHPDQPMGISDITQRVDAQLTPVVIAATRHAESLCRIERLKGEREAIQLQIIAETDNAHELERDMLAKARAETERVCAGSLLARQRDNMEAQDE